MNIHTAPHAIEIAAHDINVRWADRQARFSAAFLRSHCRCTECRLALARQNHTVTAPADLAVTGANAIGNYGVQLHFSDGHERGVYPWVYLRELGEHVA